MTDARSIGPAGFHGSRVQTANGENHSATDSSVQISTRSIWKLSIIVTGILQRNDVPRRLKPCQTIFFYAQAHFFLTENVLGSRVEGCPCIPWPHLTVGKAIGIDIFFRSTETRLFFFFFFTTPSNPTSSNPSLPYSLPNTTKKPKAKPPFSPLTPTRDPEPST